MELLREVSPKLWERCVVSWVSIHHWVPHTGGRGSHTTCLAAEVSRRRTGRVLLPNSTSVLEATPRGGEP